MQSRTLSTCHTNTEERSVSIPPNRQFNIHILLSQTATVGHDIFVILLCTGDAAGRLKLTIHLCLVPSTSIWGHASCPPQAFIALCLSTGTTKFYPTLSTSLWSKAQLSGTALLYPVYYLIRTQYTQNICDSSTQQYKNEVWRNYYLQVWVYTVFKNYLSGSFKNW